MVVGIYSVPDAVSPKRRCSEGSAVVQCRPHKRWRNDEANHVVAIEAPAQEPSSSVVLLEENGGIWHVDGLLELLAGALCATFGADPSTLDMGCGVSTPRSSCPDHEDNKRADSYSPQYQSLRGSDPLQEQQLLPQRPSLTALTEVNLRAHTAASAQLAAAAASLRLPASPDNDEDRSSVASLSAWVMGTPSPRRRGSEGGAPQGLAASGAAPGGAPCVFSFPRRCSFGGSGGFLSGGAGDGPELRWPRRRLPAAAR